VRHPRWSVLVAIWGLLAFNAGCGLGASSFTGTFVADQRPSQILFANLTQSDKDVTGFLLVVQPDGKGATKSQTFPVTGKADKQTVSLTTSAFFVSVPIVGKKDGQTLTLSLPNASGVMQSASLKPANQEEFNRVVGQWSESLGEAHRQQVADQAKRKALQDQASTLHSNIDDLRSRAKRFGLLLTEVDETLGDQRSALQQLEKDLANVRREAAKRPMEQYQACQTTRYAYEQTMTYIYRQTLKYHRGRFEERAKELDISLGQVQERAKVTHQSARTLADLLVHSPPSAPLPATPGAEEAPIAEYLAAATATRQGLIDRRSTNSEILKSADGLMGDGRTALDSALALVRCNS
jgi:hypothetical protein